MSDGVGPDRGCFLTSALQAFLCKIIPWEACSDADFDPAGLGLGPGFCISTELPGDADAAGPRARL